jgi:hypothetical protein
MLASIEEYLAEKAKKEEIEVEIGRRREIASQATLVLKAPPLTLLLGIPLDILLQFMTTLHQRGRRLMVFLHPPPPLALSPPLIAIGRSNTRNQLLNTWLDGGMMQISLSMLPAHLITNLC